MPRFKYYLSEGLDRPEPIFGLWMENAKGFSDVSGDTVLKAGLPLPMFPDYQTWLSLIAQKRRCGRCWRFVRNHADLVHHVEVHHPGAPLYFPQGGN